MIDLSNYTIDQLTQLQSKVNNLISDYSDGHIYICKIKSYGRNSTNKNIKNTKTLQDLCYEYNGDNGIVETIGIFVNVCVVIFIILLLMKLFISISWFIVFLPIIIPGILIMWENKDLNQFIHIRYNI